MPHSDPLYLLGPPNPGCFYLWCAPIPYSWSRWCPGGCTSSIMPGAYDQRGGAWGLLLAAKPDITAMHFTWIKPRRNFPWPILTQPLLPYPAFLSLPHKFSLKALFLYIQCIRILVSGSASREPNLHRSPVAPNRSLPYFSRGLSLVVEVHSSLPLWGQNHNHLLGWLKTTRLTRYIHERQHSKTLTIQNRMPQPDPSGSTSSSPGWMSRRQGRPRRCVA